nr:hypothetical protein [Methanofollis formosanus]
MHFFPCVSGHQDARNVITVFPNLSEKLDAVHAGHIKVRDTDIEIFCFKGVKGIYSREVKGDGGVDGAFKKNPDNLEKPGVIVYREDTDLNRGVWGHDLVMMYPGINIFLSLQDPCENIFRRTGVSG